MRREKRNADRHRELFSTAATAPYSPPPFSSSATTSTVALLALEMFSSAAAALLALDTFTAALYVMKIEVSKNSEPAASRFPGKTHDLL